MWESWPAEKCVRKLTRKEMGEKADMKRSEWESSPAEKWVRKLTCREVGDKADLQRSGGEKADLQRSGWESWLPGWPAEPNPTSTGCHDRVNSNFFAKTNRINTLAKCYGCYDNLSPIIICWDRCFWIGHFVSFFEKNGKLVKNYYYFYFFNNLMGNANKFC